MPGRIGVWSSGFPARSVTSALTTALYFAPGGRLALGFRVVFWGAASWATVAEKAVVEPTL